MILHHYWFEFLMPSAQLQELGVQQGCGVTAFNADDARLLLREVVFRGQQPPPARCHAIQSPTAAGKIGLHRQTAPLKWRGVWFPLGFSVYNFRVTQKGRTG